MASCQECGNNMSCAVSCAACGTLATPGQENKQRTSSHSAATPPDLPESWKKKFSIIDKAGGTKLPKMRELNFGELFRINLNIWAYLFGPLYYLAKGMWKKAVVLSGLCMIGTAILDAVLESIGMPSTITRFIAPAVFGVRANIDYYKKVIQDDNGWW